MPLIGALVVLAGSVGYAPQPQQCAMPAPSARGRALVCAVTVVDNSLLRAQRAVDELLVAADLLDDRGECILGRDDIATALDDMHLTGGSGEPQPEGAALPAEFLPPDLLDGRPVDATALVKGLLPRVLAAHPIFLHMTELLLAEEFYASVYFGTAERAASPSLDFGQLSRRLVASIHLFERLAALPHSRRRQLASFYEAQLCAARLARGQQPTTTPRSVRETLMGGFLDLKGESVLASINAFEMLRRCGAADDDSTHSMAPAPPTQGAAGDSTPYRCGGSRCVDEQPGSRRTDVRDDEGGTRRVDGDQGRGCAMGGLQDRRGSPVRLPRDARSLSRVLNEIMGVNIFEAVLSNLSFAYWPDNARAGMALLLLNGAPFTAASLAQEGLDFSWFSLYLSWNANFIWPSHFMKDMMCFSMLLTPAVALDGPQTFGYNRAHTLFWVVRSAQLTRLKEERARANSVPSEAPCFHCRGAPLPHDRQPLTTQMARLTRAEGEALARAAGEDVGGGALWWRLALEVAPEQLRRAWSLYTMMPKSSPTKLRLL